MVKSSIKHIAVSPINKDIINMNYIYKIEILFTNTGN